MSDFSAGLGANTYVSGPGGPSTPAESMPSGSGGPGANMPMTSAVLIPLGMAAAGLGGLYWLFRREGGAGLPPLRVDAANAVNVYLSWMLLNVPLKLLAYKYHGHKVSQAFLLVA